MLGVDKLDQLSSYYSFLHCSVKWWRKVFFWCIEVAVVNAYIIHKSQTTQQGKKCLTHLAFRRQLIEALSETLNQPPKRRQSATSTVERLQPVRHYPAKGERRLDCIVCSKRGEGSVRHLTAYTCGTCSSRPHLCPAPCFEDYHTKKNYRS